jgi:hypothetical protein
MGVRPKNIEEDSWAYTLPHEIGFLIQELAETEAEKLKLSRLSTSAYLERTIRRLAEENLSSERRERARIRGVERTKERRQRFVEREKAAQALL